MKITLNPDAEVVRMIREGLAARDGHCPCRFEMTPDTVCMCREFREQIRDPDFEGYCHCMLYYKSREGDGNDGGSQGNQEQFQD